MKFQNSAVNKWYVPTQYIFDFFVFNIAVTKMRYWGRLLRLSLRGYFSLCTVKVLYRANLGRSTQNCLPRIPAVGELQGAPKRNLFAPVVRSN